MCNAGVTWDGVIWKMTEQQWDTVIGTNLKGYFNYNKAAAIVFKDQKYGKIVNISSINGMRGKFAQANYAASKGGEIAMSKSLAKELGKFNVNVNVVAPGMVLTDMMANIAPEFQKKALDETVVGRFATPEDVAHLVAVPVLGSLAARDRRGHQDRRRTVHMTEPGLGTLAARAPSSWNCPIAKAAARCCSIQEQTCSPSCSDVGNGRRDPDARRSRFPFQDEHRANARCSGART